MDSVIKANNLSLTYDQRELIIKDASFDIKTGEFIFITGKSGSGKSTILKSLYGALRPVGGELTVCGLGMSKITDVKLGFLRKHLGVIFQDYRLIKEWSVEKNVMLPLHVSGFSKSVCTTQVQRLLKHVKLLHKAGKYPMELSGGEQQRVAVARALAHNPVLLLADEPTGNLDDYSSDVIWDLLKGAKYHLGATVLVVTHRIPATISIEHRHFFLEGGKLNEVH